jgi:hypothetical protein
LKMRPESLTLLSGPGCLSRFNGDGFALVQRVLNPAQCEAAAANATLASAGSAGTRNLLSQPWCELIAKQVREHPVLSSIVPPSFAATQCTYFEKSRSRNWLVSTHQDLSIPVAERVDHASLSGWSEKEGCLYVQAPGPALSIWTSRAPAGPSVATCSLTRPSRRNAGRAPDGVSHVYQQAAPDTCLEAGRREKRASRMAPMKKPDTSTGLPPAELISRKIAELGDWRGETLARMRKLIQQAAPGVVEEWKWMGTPVWSHDGIICTGESYKSVVKLTFAKGASLKDPARLFNSSLDGNVRRAIDIHEGEKVDATAFKALIREAVALNAAGKPKAAKKAKS